MGCPSIGICLILFSWLDWGYGILGGRSRYIVSFASHHIKGKCYQHDLSLLILTLITWLRHWLSGFFTVKSLLLPLSMLYCWAAFHVLIIHLCIFFGEMSIQNFFKIEVLRNTLFFFKHLYWSMIALQWCVSFCFIPKWISYTYTYVPISLPSCISLPPTLPIPHL